MTTKTKAEILALLKIGANGGDPSNPMADDHEFDSLMLDPLADAILGGLQLATQPDADANADGLIDAGSSFAGALLALHGEELGDFMGSVGAYMAQNGGNPAEEGDTAPPATPASNLVLQANHAAFAFSEGLIVVPSVGELQALLQVFGMMPAEPEV